MSKKSLSKKCVNLHKIKNINLIKIHNLINMKINKKWSKNIKNRGGHFSALKPGPVVPPGTQKTPDQAARISQSAVFGHLSDILAFFRGGSIFGVFFTFSWFSFYHFSGFCVFAFCHFFTFSDFIDFPLFMFCWFLSIFVTFLLVDIFLITFCH